jgi:hypothetical protein
MEWLQMVPVLLVFAVVGVMVGALLSHLILRFGKKQEKTFLNELFGRFAWRRRSRPEGVAVTKEEAIAVTKEEAIAVVAMAENIIAERVVTEENIAEGAVSEEAVAEAGDNELYSGRVELRIAKPADFIQVLRLQAFLREVAGLRLVSVGGSADGDSTIVVHAEERLPLPSILRQEPIVNNVMKRDNGLQLVMETI